MKRMILIGVLLLFAAVVLGDLTTCEECDKIDEAWKAIRDGLSIQTPNDGKFYNPVQGWTSISIYITQAVTTAGPCVAPNQCIDSFSCQLATQDSCSDGLWCCPPKEVVAPPQSPKCGYIGGYCVQAPRRCEGTVAPVESNDCPTPELCCLRS